MGYAADCALRHAQALAGYLHNCSSTYIVHIALKELGIPSGSEGFLFAKQAILILCKNHAQTLTNGVYDSVGKLSNPPFDENAVECAIRRAIKRAWENRDEKIWRCYFPAENDGRISCPSTRTFLFAVIDFVTLWKVLCEEGTYGK